MSMSAVMDTSASRHVPSSASRIAHVTVLTDMAAAAPTWRELEDGGALMTPYQRFAFQDAWARHVATAESATPYIVVASDHQHNPVMLLPLAIRSEHGLRVARFFGGKHVAFNMPLCRPDFAANATRDEMTSLIEQMRGLPGSADVLALIRQPASWLGTANPLSHLPHQASTNDCPVMPMRPGAPPTDYISSGFRRRLKGKERKLQAMPGYRYEIAADDAAIDRVLDAFFRIKPLRMAEQKLPNVFADPGIEAFIRDACHRRVGGKRAIEIHTLTCDDEMIAMFAGVADANRFSMMFNTYTMSGNAKHSPGQILIRDIIDHFAAEGITSFDLGVGSDDYKRLFCKDDEAIFDSYLALSGRGVMAATAMSSLTRIKRLVKHNPALKQAAMTLRAALRR
jgi:CelD/BcsL family acetyltransferase involved in cellulose biosynthesis